MKCYPINPWNIERLHRAGRVDPGGLGRRSVLRGVAGSAATFGLAGGLAGAGLVGLTGRRAAADSDLVTDAGQVVQFFVVLVKGLQLVLEAAQLAHKIQDEIYKMFESKDPIVDPKHLTSAIGEALQGGAIPEAIAVSFNLTDHDDGLALKYARSEPLSSEAAPALISRDAMKAFALTRTDVQATVEEQLPRLSFKAYPVLSRGTLRHGDRHVTFGELTKGGAFDTAILTVG
ncbi:MAG: hypothetical protein GC191_00700 [Azospirillum sp.]|nr:hypothetical protein [Azospirillum sp.]